MGELETVIGLEVHAQLRTRSKMFCGCPNDPSAAEPNTRVCPICMGYPGTLPVINARAVRLTLRTALALRCTIPHWAQFHRKSYFYPDLPKGYQISQYDLPLGREGWLEIPTASGQAKRVRVRRVHVEEDTARLLHGPEGSRVDFNRAGVPLMEIVTEPDLSSPEEARDFLQRLRTLLRYLEVSSGNMEEGALRLEPSVSVRPLAQAAAGTRVEIKNLNSFRSAVEALAYEVERQRTLLEKGAPVLQETVGWDEENRRTVVQRRKEQAEDYRYLPEPDLPPLEISAQELEQIRAEIPELPAERAARLQQALGLSAHQAALLTAEREVADWFEAAVGAGGDAGTLANFVTNVIFSLMRESGGSISRLDPAQLAGLLTETAAGLYSSTAAASMVAEAWQGTSLAELRRDPRYRQISAAEQLAAAAESVLQENSQAVEDYLGGKHTAIQFLVGQLMRRTGGQANPQVARQVLEEKLQQRARSSA